ncbi:MAG TPA: hypothetical protein VKH81_13160 [Candidatus Angelobacter sp.]|nr:hypothetical protein [Candidatus Angelobacter sp.]
MLEIGVDPGHPGGQCLVGRYFYRCHGIDIFIKGTRNQDGSFLLSDNL